GVAVTVIAAVPSLPSLVAVMVAVPTDTPLTRPLLLTVATVALLVPHVTTFPLNGAPLASCGVAVSCKVPWTATLPAVGLMSTEATLVSRPASPWSVHAARTTRPATDTFPIRASRRDNLCLNVMGNPPAAHLQATPRD